MENEKMLTAADAASFLRISVGYLYKLTSAKKIPFYKPFGNRIFFDREELKALLRGSKIESSRS